MMISKSAVGLMLIALGALAFLYQGLDYLMRDRGAATGSVRAEHRHHVPAPPVIGTLSLMGGIVLLLADKKGLGRMEVGS